MADETAVKDPPKEGKEAAPAVAKKSSGMVPMIAGVGLVVALGVGGTWYALGSLLAKPDDGEKKKQEEAEHAKHASLLHSSQEFALGDLMSNVRGQGGRRYIKMNCVLWVATTAATTMGLAGGGHGHGKGGGGTEVKRIVQTRFEEHLKSYDLDDLTGPNIYKQLEKGFTDIFEREAHGLFPELPADGKLVRRVVLTNLLVQ